MKTKNIPEAHQDAFKTGFAEGFLKAQALTQKTNGKLIRHHPYLERNIWKEIIVLPPSDYNNVSNNYATFYWLHFLMFVS